MDTLDFKIVFYVTVVGEKIIYTSCTTNTTNIFLGEYTMHTHFKRDILKMRAFLSNLEILQSYKKGNTSFF